MDEKDTEQKLHWHPAFFKAMQLELIDFRDSLEFRYEHSLTFEPLQYLDEVRGYTVEETSPGIYQIKGDYLPIQIIESKKLPDGESFWLNALRNDLEARRLSAILKEREKRGPEAPLEAYIDIILRANPKVFKEVYEMEFEVYKKLFKDAGIVPKWVVETQEKTARNLLARRMPIEDIAQVTELPIEKVRSLAEAG